ncbi:MAG TPA: thioredoxin family protein [Acidiferrobacterales bacterium]|nr:thioredoxin family protein [Acidiferrobacterales bacterium]
MAGTDRPDALLLLTSTCPYCPAVLAALSDLVKSGDIGRLEVVNIGAHPDIAQQYGVRTVPWVRLGPFELEGLRSPAELKQWVERAGTPEGLAEYFHELLKEGALPKVSAQAARDPAALDALLRLLGDTDTELTVRIGINAVFEGMEGNLALQRTVPALIALCAHRDAHIRGDAAHLLSLTHIASVEPHLQRLLQDEVADVREIAREGLERLSTLG